MSEFYVYGLFDSNSNFPFYIGKGTGARHKKHLYDCILDRCNSHKNNKIKNIQSQGREVKSKILADDLGEHQAFSLEYLLINIHFQDLTNISRSFGAGNSSGKNNPMYGKKHSEKTKRKMSESMSGINKSEEHKSKLSSSMSERMSNPAHKEEHSRKLGAKHASEIKWLKNNTQMSHREVGEIYDVSITHVSRIVNGKNWNQVNPKKPD